MKKIRIALIQMSMSKDPAKNLGSAERLVRRAAKNGARIICLPELFKTRYFCQTESRSNFRLAEEIPGPTTDAMRKLAKETGSVLIVPLFEKRAPGIYHNSAAIIDADGRLLGVYRKMHIPDDPLYYEKYYFAPGDLGFRAFDTRFGRIAVLICWDQWYPEAARAAALNGAEILFYPTAIGAADGNKDARTEKEAWRTIQVSHAIANGVYVACVNRSGREGKLSFWGSSFVAGPGGETTAQAASAPAVLYADCEPGRIARTREAWPFLRDRRIDAYKPVLARFTGKK